MPRRDPEIDLFSGALYATLIGFIVGAFFSPEAYQYFPYFAVAYTSVLLAIAKEEELAGVSAADLPKQPPQKRPGLARARDFTPVLGSPGSRKPDSGTPARLLRNRQR
jgi:hypothetical protein